MGSGLRRAWIDSHSVQRVPADTWATNYRAKTISAIELLELTVGRIEKFEGFGGFGPPPGFA
jgi:hypothetical protein